MSAALHAWLCRGCRKQRRGEGAPLSRSRSAAQTGSRRGPLQAYGRGPGALGQLMPQAGWGLGRWASSPAPHAAACSGCADAAKRTCWRTGVRGPPVRRCAAATLRSGCQELERGPNHAPRGWERAWAAQEPRLGFRPRWPRVGRSSRLRPTRHDQFPTSHAPADRRQSVSFTRNSQVRWASRPGGGRARRRGRAKRARREHPCPGAARPRAALPRPPTGREPCPPPDGGAGRPREQPAGPRRRARPGHPVLNNAPRRPLTSPPPPCPPQFHPTPTQWRRLLPRPRWVKVAVGGAPMAPGMRRSGAWLQHGCRAVAFARARSKTARLLDLHRPCPPPSRRPWQL